MLKGAITASVGKKISGLPVPFSVQPLNVVVVLFRFHNSIHSSDVESEEPAQAISPMTMVGGGLEAEAGDTNNGNKICVKMMMGAQNQRLDFGR